MLNFWLCVFISAKFMAFTSANHQTVDCTDAAISYYTNEDGDTNEAIRRFFIANNDIAGMWLNNLAMTHGEENLFTSLYSLLFSFGQLATSADESTCTNILNLINLKSISEVREVLPRVVALLNVQGKYTSSLETLMIADNKYEFTNDFKYDFYSMVNGKTVNLNFSDSCATADYINNWLKKDGCNQYYDLMSPEQIFAELGLIIVSYINLTLNWENSFKPLKKVPINFWESEDVVKITDALYFEGYAKYAEDENLNAKLIDITVLGDWKLRIVYPNEEKELFNIIHELRNQNVFKSVFAKTELTHLKLAVPLETEVCGHEDYVDGMEFAKLLTEIFDPEFNGFSSGFDNGAGCHLSNMFNKMHLTLAGGLDTEGVPEISDDEYSDSDVISVEVNTPFSFYIICPLDTQVFAGAVYKPKTK